MTTPSRRCGLPRASDGRACQRLVTTGPCGAKHRSPAGPADGGVDDLAAGLIDRGLPPVLHGLVAVPPAPPPPAGRLKVSDLSAADCHPHILGAAARSADPEARLAAAAHPSCPPADRFALVNDPDVRVRRAAAANRNAEPGVLMAAASDADEHVRVAAADHPNLPPVVRAWIVADPAPRVRSYIARRVDLTDAERRLLRR